jgi:pyruvate/2-oxoglutarate dehydrogenase complex dihydrolipoamide acyltransferase (E2) component
MRSLKTKRSWRYDKRTIAPGEIFDVKKRGDVLILAHAGLAEVIDAEQKTEAFKAKAAAARSANQNQAPKTKPSEKAFTQMTVPELRQAAKAMGVVIEAGARKVEIIDLLRINRYGRRDMRAVRR